MGMAGWDEFLAALNVQRERVAHHFREIVFRGASGTAASAAMADDAAPAQAASALDKVWNGESTAAESLGAIKDQANAALKAQ